MSSPLNTSYSIGRHGERCAATGHVFAPGEKYVACLVDQVEQEGLERLDYALEAWETTRPSGVFAFWRGTIPEAGAPRDTIAGDDELFDLFESMADAEEPRRIAFRYALALLMVRKRLLKQVGMREASGDAGGDTPGAMLVRVKGTDPELAPIEVVNPTLDVAILTEVATQLEAVVRRGT